MMLTRCPECATVFRVTPEQLKARQGRVRCGRCHCVFNAIDALIENLPANVVSSSETPLPQNATAEGQLPEAADESIVATDSASILQMATETAPPEQHAQPVHKLEHDSAVPVAAEPEPPEHAEHPEHTAHEALVATVAPAAQEAASVERSAASDSVDSAISEPTTPGLPHVPGPDQGPGAVADQSAAEPVLEARVAEPPAMEPLLHEPPRQSPAWPWIAAAVVFAALLAGQTALFYRIELAIQYPQLRASFASICAQLDCEMPLPRHIELVSIEASDLNPDAPQKDRLRLSATLKNRADFAQEYPHLELTLTDTQDQPLLRRALSPAEYLSSVPPPAGFVARGEASVALTIDASGVPASGYRLYVFYP
jgi:predicted Zn finger-like uncharacterized protein